MKPHWNAVNGAVRGALAGVTLANCPRSPAQAEAHVQHARTLIPAYAEYG